MAECMAGPVAEGLIHRVAVHQVARRKNHPAAAALFRSPAVRWGRLGRLMYGCLLEAGEDCLSSLREVRVCGYTGLRTPLKQWNYFGSRWNR